MPDEIEAYERSGQGGPARRLFPRRIDALSDLFSFSAEFYACHGVGGDVAYSADFVIEELFTNLVKYNAGGECSIEVGLRRDGDLLEVSLTDFDSERFDMREQGEVDVSAPLDERTPGGLGIHLVRKFAKRIDYDYVDRKSRITVFLDLG